MENSPEAHRAILRLLAAFHRAVDCSFEAQNKLKHGRHRVPMPPIANAYQKFTQDTVYQMLQFVLVDEYNLGPPIPVVHRLTAHHVRLLSAYNFTEQSAAHNFWAPWVVFSTLHHAQKVITPVMVPPRSSIKVSSTTVHNLTRWHPQPDGSVFMAQYLADIDGRSVPAPPVSWHSQANRMQLLLTLGFRLAHQPMPDDYAAAMRIHNAAKVAALYNKLLRITAEWPWHPTRITPHSTRNGHLNQRSPPRRARSHQTGQ
eukprot:scaffold184461_cov29-Prasinocladus_malaysianus.AAC.2